LKIHILCDLHVEFGDFVPPVGAADVVVLAGDIHIKNHGLQWILNQNFKVPVLYVLGNHEFYREKFPGLIDQLKVEAEGTNVRVLENDAVEIGGYRFFGCTLWSDMALLGDQHISSMAAADFMNDYRLIHLSKTNQRLSPGDTKAWHAKTVRKLTEFFKAGEPERSIVVTHHAPSIKSVIERYRIYPVSAAFASNMDDFIRNHQPPLWIHGHTHESFDYHIGKTRIVCNPRGYASKAENKEFRPDFTVVV
jgi:Icc-related predicted phosphoesterase